MNKEKKTLLHEHGCAGGDKNAAPNLRFLMNRSTVIRYVSCTLGSATLFSQLINYTSEPVVGYGQIISR
jgi:hypothetical protein